MPDHWTRKRSQPSEKETKTKRSTPSGSSQRHHQATSAGGYQGTQAAPLRHHTTARPPESRTARWIRAQHQEPPLEPVDLQHVRAVSPETVASSSTLQRRLEAPNSMSGDAFSRELAIHGKSRAEPPPAFTAPSTRRPHVLQSADLVTRPLPYEPRLVPDNCVMLVVEDRDRERGTIS
jgi:hypothetical protein